MLLYQCITTFLSFGGLVALGEGIVGLDAVGAGFDVYDFRFNIAALPYLYR